MKHNGGFLCWLCISLAFFTSGSLSAEPPVIRLALYEFGVLYNSTAQNGIDKEIVDELARRTGKSFSISVLSRARIWKDLEDGNLDMSVSGIQTPERDKFAWFAPYLIIKNYAILPTSIGATPDFASFETRPDLIFGVVTSFKHGVDQDAFLDRLRKAGRIQESATAEELFKKLKAGRIQGLFSQPPVFRLYLRDLSLTASTAVVDWTPKETGVPHGLILSKKSFSSLEAQGWRSVIDAMRTDGTLLRIFSKYLTRAEALALLNFS